MKGTAGEKAEETMTCYQSITSKVNYAGSEEGARGGAARGSETLGNMKISTATCQCDAKKKSCRTMNI